MPARRPETAPFCPAWNGTRSTVARALKLIDGGALERGSVDALAEKLGITSRHLARLFERHVGASPQQVAEPRAAFSNLYGRSPSSLRATSRGRWT